MGRVRKEKSEGLVVVVVGHRLRRVTSVAKNQFGFMPRRSTMEAIFLVRQLMERYKEQKDLHVVFIDLERPGMSSGGP